MERERKGFEGDKAILRSGNQAMTEEKMYKGEHHLMFQVLSSTVAIALIGAIAFYIISSHVL